MLDRVVRWVDHVLESIVNDDVYERVIPDDRWRPVPDVIRRTFADFYRRWAIELPAELPAAIPVSIRNDRGWWLRARYAEIDGVPSVEVYASHRMTNDGHFVLRADDSVQHLDALPDMFTYPSGASEAEIAAIKEEHQSSYDRLRRRLALQGLL